LQDSPTDTMRDVTIEDPPGSLLWPAVDVGGTSIRVLLIADGGEGPPEPVVRIEIPSRRGLGALAGALRVALMEASTIAKADGHHVAHALAIGTPGRLETGPDGRRTIAPRTAINLEAFSGEMDGVDLAGELAAALGLPRSRVFWDNDAVVQGRYLIGELLGDPTSAGGLRGQTVVCINPGTGLGGCVAEVAGDGAVEVFTDGHISELLLHPVELERDLGSFRVVVGSTADGSAVELEARGGEEEYRERLPSPAAKQAEDFLSGTGLALIATGIERCASGLLSDGCFGTGGGPVDGVLLSELMDRGGEDTAARAARFVGDLGGLALARLLAVLRDGTARKSSTFPDWSPADVDRLRGVSRFILGGGITKTPLGQRMIAEAKNLLSDRPDLRLYEMDHIADDAGALGAFSLIPEGLRQSAKV